MATQTIPIYRTTTNLNSPDNKNGVWFNASDFTHDQDAHIRWLSRPNQLSVHKKYPSDVEKFRIAFDVENFQSRQIKIYIQNYKLTISGVYEERNENRLVQREFERTFDIPANADVDSMVSFITPTRMLVVEIPLNPSAEGEHLNISDNRSALRRLSFSLNKFNLSNKQGLPSALHNSPSLSTTNQQIRRIPFTKTITTTTTTTSGATAHPLEAIELLKSAGITNDNNIYTYSAYTSQHHSSNTDNQNIIIHEPNRSSTTPGQQTLLTRSDLTNSSLKIPTDLWTNGGTITIQKRKVSVTKGTNGNIDRAVTVSLSYNNADIKSTSLASTSTTPSASSNAFNQQQTNIREGYGSKALSNSKNQSRKYILEEFLQNKIWNPSLVDGSDGKKILHMRLQMKSDATLNQIKISLNAYDLRVEFNNKVSTGDRQFTIEPSYRQITLLPTCEIDQLKTELKDDGFLHIQVPIKL
ncbi:unnamed protein product [Rotaria magnacalcarata]